MRVAVMDDWQGVAAGATDWSALQAQAEVAFLPKPMPDEAAAVLESFEVLVPLRERTPLPLDHPLRTAPNCVLTPHLGYGTTDTFAQFYGESVENILAFLDGAPIRVAPRLDAAAPGRWYRGNKGEGRTMQAWAVVEFGQDLQSVDLPMPDPVGTEVLVEVTHCGVCHSDLHIWEGFYDLGGGKRLDMRDRGMVLPQALGHEIAGRVARLGPDAKGVAVGDVRVVYPWVGCGHCAQCVAEQDHMCASLRPLGVLQAGGFATHVVAPHPRHLIDPGTLDPAVAATYACSGITVLSAIRKVLPLPPEEPVVLVGAGGLGLNAIHVLRALGHANIVVVDLGAEKRQAALDAGARTAVDGSGDGVTARILEACGGPVAAVIDMVNGSATAAFAFAALRKGGKLVQVGLFGGELTVPLPTMAMRALTVQGSFVGSPGDLRDLVGLAQEGGVDPLPVTQMPKDQANTALMRLRDGAVNGRIVLRSSAA